MMVRTFGVVLPSTYVICRWILLILSYFKLVWRTEFLFWVCSHLFPAHLLSPRARLCFDGTPINVLTYRPEVTQMIQFILINFTHWSHAMIHLCKTILTLWKICSNNHVLTIPTEFPMFISMDYPFAFLKLDYRCWLYCLGSVRTFTHHGHVRVSLQLVDILTNAFTTHQQLAVSQLRLKHAQ